MAKIYELSKQIVDWFLLEDPDGMDIGTEHFHYTHSDAVPFGYVGSFKSQNFRFGNPGDSHGQAGISSLHGPYCGRFWIRRTEDSEGDPIVYKIISFWTYPQSKEILDKILSDMKDKAKGTMSFDDFIVELENGSFVPVKDYTGPVSRHSVKNPEKLIKAKNDMSFYDYKNLPKEVPALPGETPEEHRFRKWGGDSVQKKKNRIMSEDDIIRECIIEHYGKDILAHYKREKYINEKR